MRGKETRVSESDGVVCCGLLCGVPSLTTKVRGVIILLPVQYYGAAVPYTTTFCSWRNRNGHESSTLLPRLCILGDL
jgi:hypothetical protein